MSARRNGRAFLVWLRRVHGWLGLWGAALGLLFGVSGFVLNHRAVMKLDLARMEAREFQLPLTEPLPKDQAELTRWAQQALDLRHAPARRPPRAMTKAQAEVTIAGRSVAQPTQWQVEFQLPQSAISIDYVAGNRYAAVTRQDANLLAFISRMHKGVGMNAGWILLADSVAGALVVLCMTGVLLWTRLRGSRLVMSALGLGSTALAALFTLQSM